MKKQLLTLFAMVGGLALMAQTPSPSFAVNQDAAYPVTYTLPAVKFLDAVDANVVWTMGYDINFPSRNYCYYSKTTNGGTSFAGGQIYSDTNTYVVANMEGIDANTAWVASFIKSSKNKGAIHRTTNGGSAWFNMTAPNMYTNTAAFTNFVSFFTPSVGIVNGDPVNGEFEIWRTTDGGNNWSMVPGANMPNPLTGEFAITNLYYKHGSNNLWFGTNAGRMYRTADAGITWSVATVAPTSTLLEIAFSSPMNGITSVFSSSQTVELFNTFDGGQTWNFIGQPANLGYADFAGVPGTGMLISVGLGAGNEIVSSSSNNGATWVDLQSTVIPYTTVDMVDGSTGWLGSLGFTQSQTFTNIWKKSGTAFSGTVSPTASFTMNPVICLSGPTASLIPANSSFGTPQNVYNWSGSSGVVISSPSASAPVISFPSAGVYTITLTANNGIGINTSSQQVTVTACSTPVATYTVPTSICTNYSFTASNVSTGAPAPTYSWSVIPSAQSTISPSPFAASPSIRLGNASNYTVTMVATNAAGTTSYSQVVTPAICAPVPNFLVPAKFVYCPSNTSYTTSFTSTNSSSSPPGGAMSYTWTWAPTAGVVVVPNQFAPNINVTPSSGITQMTITLRARNASGTSSLVQVVDIEDCLTVGMKENTLESQVSIFPNPAKDFIDVKLPATAVGSTVKITNVLGSVIYQESTEKQNLHLNLANNPKGIYFITVQSNGEKITKKIIVE